MDLDRIDALITFIGLASQTVTAALLILLFRLLGSLARRRPYFAVWANAWLVLTLALVALVLRTAPTPLLAGLQAYPWWEPVCEFVYLLGKLTFFMLLLSGALLYIRGLPGQRFGRLAVAGVLGYGLLAFTMAEGIRDLVIWQSPVAILACGFACWLLLSVPSGRASLGSTTTGAIFGLIALTWLGYFSVYQLATEADFHYGFPGLIARYGAYLDLVLHAVLAYGMVRLLLEDSKHETDAAYAEMEHAHRRLLTESLKDSLTGVFNRHAYTEGMGLESARTTFGAIAVFDLDNLKQVNDAYGHSTGDELLKHFAAVLRSGLRPTDKLYRWGGDEFLLILPRATADNALERLQGLLAAAPPLFHPQGEINISVSIGCADYVSGMQMEAAIHQADAMMYEDKRQRKTQPGAAHGATGDVPAG